MTTEKQEAPPDCQRRNQDEFSCFRCHDGLTPLYCLNCAEAVLKAKLSSSAESELSRAASVERMAEKLAEVLGRARNTLFIECNYSAKFEKLYGWQVNECDEALTAYRESQKKALGNCGSFYDVRTT